MRPVNRDAQVVILVGACKGEQIEENRHVFPNAIIFAIEPFPDNAEIIRTRFGNDDKVVVVQKAAWSKNGTKQIIDYGESHKHSFFFRPTSEPKRRGKLEVEAIDFAEFIDTFPKVDYVRMNIEGSEYEVLLHCFEMGVMDKIKSLQIEFHANRIPGLDERDKELKKKLTAWGVKNQADRLWRKTT